jgi:hypothetical protein
MSSPRSTPAAQLDILIAETERHLASDTAASIPVGLVRSLIDRAQDLSAILSILSQAGLQLEIVWDDDDQAERWRWRWRTGPWVHGCETLGAAIAAALSVRLRA